MSVSVKDHTCEPATPKCQGCKTSILLVPMCGDTIDNFAKKAASKAMGAEMPVVFTFNDLEMIVYPGDTASTIAHLYTALSQARYLGAKLEKLGIYS